MKKQVNRKEKHIENIKAMQDALNIKGKTEKQKTGEPLKK